MTDIELNRTSTLQSINSNGNVDDEEESLLQQQHEALVNGSFWVFVSHLQSSINHLSKWIISGLFVIVLLWKHDAESLWAVMGSIINVILSVVLKRILNQRRPVSSLRSDPGMPSSHAQSIFYISVFLILSIVDWLRINKISLILSGLVLAFAAYLSWLRFSRGLHTIIQVVVGAVVGVIFSILWYWSWKGIVNHEFDSYLWVRIIIYLCSAGFCLGLLLYVIKNWFRDEQGSSYFVVYIRCSFQTEQIDSI